MLLAMTSMLSRSAVRAEALMRSVLANPICLLPTPCY